MNFQMTIDGNLELKDVDITSVVRGLMDKKCCIDKCESVSCKKLMCQKHYMRKRRKQPMQTWKEKFIINNLPKDGIGKVPLSKRKFTTVDEEDYEFLIKSNWMVDSRGYSSRCVFNKDGKRIRILMHRVIMKTPDEMHTDHINHDPLDNRKSNLRICTRNQNQWNRSKNKNCLYKGARFCPNDNKWRSSIRVCGAWVHLGYFKTATEAAESYDKYASIIFGEFACLNFPLPSHK